MVTGGSGKVKSRNDLDQSTKLLVVRQNLGGHTAKTELERGKDEDGDLFIVTTV